MAAMDLRDGQVVRLLRGDFGRETMYSHDPLDIARSLTSTGVRWLHIVDLDGARAGERRQASLIGQVIRAMGSAVPCQVAGGLRTEEAVAAAIEDGARRVVLGTAALQDPSFAGHLVERFGANRIACAIDVRAGRAQGHG